MKQIITLALEQNYGIDVVSINHIRTMIGRVYKVETPNRSLVVKWYQPHLNKMAIYAVQVQQYLSTTTSVVPMLHLSLLQEPYILLEGGVFIVMDYIEGREVTKLDFDLVLDAFNQIQAAMKKYPFPLHKGNEEYYYKRYLKLMYDSSYEPQKISEIASIAKELFQAVNRLEKGYCHSDFHTGNMLVANQRVFIFDFDASHIWTPYIDLVTYVDQTNFNTFRAEDLDATTKLLKQSIPMDVSFQDVLAFLPIRHMEIIPNILDAEENHRLEQPFMDEQYQWIKAFYHQWKVL